MNLRAAALLLLLAVPFQHMAAATISYVGNLDGLSESPSNASPGTGFTRVTIDDVLNTMRVEVNFTGLLGGVTASHIHVINGPGDTITSDTLGPVATTTPTFLGFPSGVTSGTYDVTFDMTLASSYRAGFVTSAGSIDLARAALFSGISEGRAYLNIHTSTVPAGEIRAFLTAEVPEPATVGMISIALVGLVALRRGRKISA